MSAKRCRVDWSMTVRGSYEYESDDPTKPPTTDDGVANLYQLIDIDPMLNVTNKDISVSIIELPPENDKAD